MHRRTRKYATTSFPLTQNAGQHGCETFLVKDPAVWQPNDRSLVCAFTEHTTDTMVSFTEQDYKKTEKLRILLPTAVPTVFPDYPSYMSTRSTRAPRKKRPRLEVEDDNTQSCA
ncbi:hypothetical protein HPB49_012392 [Dermacentor silvarum]|uniref:Uncharacterized protein n=1 Tax=Dermacentor silvarum TaxID=543639 RepID=A0ACB8CXD6_DERSI|nr:hypothetical protein HPB49_012392 [Dermacentor silvarum]